MRGVVAGGDDNARPPVLLVHGATTRAGVVVPPLACPLLVVTGGGDRLWPRRRYEGFPLPAASLTAPDASHGGLVLAPATLATLVPAVVRWLEAARPR